MFPQINLQLSVFAKLTGQQTPGPPCPVLRTRGIRGTPWYVTYGVQLVLRSSLSALRHLSLPQAFLWLSITPYRPPCQFIPWSDGHGSCLHYMADSTAVRCREYSSPATLRPPTAPSCFISNFLPPPTYPPSSPEPFLARPSPPPLTWTLFNLASVV